MRACGEVSANLPPAVLDQPAFNRNRLKAEKLIDSKVLEQLIRVQWTLAALMLARPFAPAMPLTFSAKALTRLYSLSLVCALFKAAPRISPRDAPLSVEPN